MQTAAERSVSESKSVLEHFRVSLKTCESTNMTRRRQM